MKKINSINIMGKKVKVKHKKLDNLHGAFNGDKNLIEIDSNILEDPELYRSTLIHECTHAILFYSGLNELFQGEMEEAVVRCIEYNLLPVIERINNGI